MTTEPYETIGFRAPTSVKEAALKDAARLGLTTAEYGRMAFARQLAARVDQATADEFRTPPTKKELAAQRRARAAAEAAGGSQANGHAPLARTEVEPIPKGGKR